MPGSGGNPGYGGGPNIALGSGVAAALAIAASATGGFPAQTFTTWVPVDNSGVALTFTGVSAAYTRTGNLVTVYAQLTYPSTADVTAASIGGLPFAVANANYAALPFIIYGAGMAAGSQGVLAKNALTFNILALTGAIAQQTNANMSTKTLTFSVTYPVA